VPTRPVDAAVRIGIVGAGHIGGALAQLFTRAGHEVALANSRGPETLADQVAALGPTAHAATATDAAAFGELVVVSIPLHAYTSLDPAPYAGKIVVDTNNYYPGRDGHIAALDEKRATSSGLLAEHLGGGAKVLKAFNAIYSAHLRDLGKPGAPAADRRAIPIAGDDAAAKATLTGLIDEIGFTAVDTGFLADSWRQEPDTPVYGAEVGPDQATVLIAQAQR
jgi:8-hydroxy-5-deazaflavin:NADPH oxidoreductase